MKHLFTLLFLVPALVFGQTNVVLRYPNASDPGQRNTLIGPYAGNTTMTGRGNVLILPEV